MTSESFSTTMLLSGNNTGIPVPPEVVERLGGGKRAAVHVVVNGFEYDSTLGAMGGRTLIPFSSDKRAASGIGGNDPIEVTLTLDASPRSVDVPSDLAAALDDGGVRTAWDALAPSRRKADAASVGSAKAPETRQRRIDGIVTRLRG